MDNDIISLFQQTSPIYGIIEDTNEPTDFGPPTGRVKVRVYGIHPDNNEEVPTEDLPWSQVRVSPSQGVLNSHLREGQMVSVEFPNGMGTQAPIVTGLLHGLVRPKTKKTANYKPKAFENNSKKPVQIDPPAGVTPVDERVSTLGAAAIGDIKNMAVYRTNSVLEHGCDFRFFFTLPRLDIGLPELADAIKQLKDAWKNGKNTAMMVMRGVISIINAQLKKVLDAILAALSFDPTGILSKTYHLGKMIIRDIADLLKQIAEYVETISFFYNLVTNINVIINYLKSLPAKIIAVIKQCLEQFTQSIQNLLNVIKSIPGLAATGLDAIFEELGVASQEAYATAQQSSYYVPSANVTVDTAAANSHTDLVTILLYDTTADHANLINNFISTNYANAEVIMANISANTYNPNSIQTP